MTTDDARGVLFPRRLPTFERRPAPAPLADVVHWFWIPQWNLPDGEVSVQRLLPFPTSNLVVDPHGVALVGPTTGISEQRLTGRGWAVGARLRPAGLAALHDAPATLRDGRVGVDAGDLAERVIAAMGETSDARRTRVEPSEGWAPGGGEQDRRGVDVELAVDTLGTWIADRALPVSEEPLLANRMEDIVARDRDVVRVEQLAERLHISARGVQRLAARYVGIPPLAIIRRYRLQEAAAAIREDPRVGLAEIATRLGYADHAHLTSDFRTVLGLTPTDYRTSV